MPYRQKLHTDGRECLDCEQPIYMSSCDAETCDGRACPDCGTGCDLDFIDDEDSVCANERQWHD